MFTISQFPLLKPGLQLKFLSPSSQIPHTFQQNLLLNNSHPILNPSLKEFSFEGLTLLL
jgi:hypothetical protein